ncbi:MAG: flagellar motor protein MotA [Alphaproteobacteria bacterium]
MSRPQVFLYRMLGFLVIVLLVAAAFFATLSQFFMANAVINGVILGVLALGVIYIFRQVAMLYPEVKWIETFRRSQPGLSVQRPPRLLAPMATMLGERAGGLSLSAISMRSLLDGISARLDESRDISRYLIGLLIFLGLLGTFWGLLQTIYSVGDVVGGLSAGEGNVADIFGSLKEGLTAPLGGMGTAFSSSLFGLAGSLLLGFLDLQASQAQNRFYNELEDWLSSLTRLSSGLPTIGEGDPSIPAYVSALLEQTADSLENLQRTLARGEEGRMAANANLQQLTEKLATLSDQMRTEQQLMMKLGESQMSMKPLLQKLSEISGRDEAGIDDASRAHIRNIDVCMMRLLEETVSGRTQMVEELRSEIKLLARTIAAANETKRH